MTKAGRGLATTVVFIVFNLSIQYSGANTILSFGDSYELGFVFAGLPAGDMDVTGYVNQLIGMAPNTFATVAPNSFARSGNSFSPLDPAVLVLPRATYSQYQDFSKDPTTLSLNLSAGYEYLLAKYDGPNSGTEVWYVGNLTGSVTIPTFNGQYGISGTSFFTPGITVPDVCATAALLALTLAPLAFARRRIGCFPQC